MSRGIYYIITASFVFGIINFMVKFYAHIPSIQIVFFRSLVSLVLSYAVVRRKQLKVFNQHTPTLFLRGLFGACALVMYFETIQNIPLGTAVTLLYLAPIFTVILAYFISKEKTNWQQWPFFILSFLGAVLIKSFNDAIPLKYFALGITAAVFAGLAYNMIRKLKTQVDTHLIILYFPLVTIPLIFPFVVYSWVMPTWQDLGALLSLGVLTQIAQIFMTKAYQVSEAKEVSHYNYLTVLYAFMAGALFFGETIRWTSVLGVICILTGVYFSTRFAKKSS